MFTIISHVPIKTHPSCTLTTHQDFHLFLEEARKNTYTAWIVDLDNISSLHSDLLMELYRGEPLLVVSQSPLERLQSKFPNFKIIGALKKEISEDIIQKLTAYEEDLKEEKVQLEQLGNQFPQLSTLKNYLEHMKQYALISWELIHQYRQVYYQIVSGKSGDLTLMQSVKKREELLEKLIKDIHRSRKILYS